ncbi:MAG: DegT/DnrJ/EryC1/StrS family aminotransferase [Candidatus Limiplasma sp.]|nr:DegT/DnrJ/EryC1/StrS family aminotransferase [Candidatus Limiplasma sp.]
MEFRDLSAQYEALKKEIDEGIAQVISRGHFILGSQVEELEGKLAAYVGRRYCISCANGTDALTLALMAWGIGPGDAVFTADFTYFASAGCASVLGATAIPVDIDPRTFNLSPDALEAAIQRVEREGKLRPRALIPVDLFGLPADYPRLEAIAQSHGLMVLEDAAQSFSGSLNGKRACAFGGSAATSFFPSKPLGCYGDGGAIFTDSDQEAALLRSLRAQGRSPQDKYDNRLIGLNSRLDTLQAAILLPKLEALQRYELKAISRVAEAYTQELGDAVVTPYIPEGYHSAWAQYSILLRDAGQREGLRQHLREAGIPTMIYYPKAVHRQTAYASMGFEDSLFPVTLDVTQRILSLPMHPYLTQEEVRRVAQAVKAFIGG